MTTVTVKRPSECQPQELEEFATLVCTGGEVDENKLLQRIQEARALARAFEADALIGGAALKSPNANYRRKILKKAQANADPDNIRYELGWIIVHKDRRMEGISKKLVTALLNGVEDSIYATSRTNNKAAHKLLVEFGFGKAGVEYPSLQHQNETLALFIRPPS